MVSTLGKMVRTKESKNHLPEKSDTESTKPEVFSVV